MFPVPLRPAHSRKLRSLGIGAAIAVGASLGVLAPPALAAPANDNFAGREIIPSTLPVHLTESNVGATREEGEHINDFGKGRSIWWEWEAPSSGWTTVSTCGSEMLAYINAFEGTELGHLTSMTDPRTNASSGPPCYATGTAYTFMAIMGHHYVIGADGNGFYVPPLPPEEPVIPSGEGTINLSIEATPPPPNDDFASPIRLGDRLDEAHQSPFEEPNEDEYFIEQRPGYNWGATKQEGEPDHPGDPGGASVWYAWTPSRSGEARIDLQGGGPTLLALYTGSTLTGLTPVASSTPESLPPALSAQVVAGQEYRIAVDGSHAEHAPNEPWRGTFMGSYAITLMLKSPPLAQCASCGAPSPPPASPSSPLPIFPTVTLGSHRVNAGAHQASFRFSSPTTGASFVCKVDGAAYKSCSSPFKVKGLKPGKHVFRVLATVNGTTSTSPAVVAFTVRASHPRHHQAR